MLVEQAAAVCDLAWTRGDTVGMSFKLIGLGGLAGESWAAQIRRGSSRHSELLDSFVVVASVDGDDCLVSVGLPPASAVDAGCWWWDLQSVGEGAGVRTWISGRVTVRGDVTDV